VTDQADQLELFCGHCAGSGVVMNYATVGDGEYQVWPSPCPVCRPANVPEAWQAIACQLGRRPPKDRPVPGC
jgi:hypothetical protein